MAPASMPPGPSAPRWLQTMRWWTRPVPFFERCRARHGRRFTIRLLGAPPFVVLADPGDVKDVFTAPADVLHPGSGARILEPVVGPNSVILLDEDAHLSQRRLMLPAFHGEQVARLADVMSEVAAAEVERWPRDKPVALHPRLQALTLEVILRTVFGLEEGARLDRLREHLTSVLAVGASPVSMLPVLQRDLGPGSPWRRFLHMRDVVDAELFALIDERRAQAGERDDVLSLLLGARHEDGSPMSAQELRDELMTLLVAGHETTATALAWALERLVRHPAVLDRLVAEVREQGTEGEYLDAVVKETLRLRPVVPAVIRRLTGPMELGGYELPAGTFVSPSIYLTHRRPDVYPEPEAFRPERFLESPAGTYTWIPFGGGVRRCLGATFALFEMKVVLATVLEQVHLRTLDDRDEAITRRAITFAPRREGRIVLAA
jgi:cytochrome P450 family 135